MTLREMKARFLAPHILAIWMAAAGIATLAGPFGTYEMPVVARGVYWLISIGIAIVLSSVIIGWSYKTTVLARLPAILRGLTGALIFSVIYTVLLVWFGELFFGGNGFPGPVLMFSYVAPVCVAITCIIHLLPMPMPASVDKSPGAPPFLKRLKPSLGRNLIRLSMQDHYVEAVTDKGSQLILMRFSDALDELDGITGWRIHRSHWVAEAGLQGLRREGGKTLITTTDAAQLPVSRTYLPVLRDAGVIRRLS